MFNTVIQRYISDKEKDAAKLNVKTMTEDRYVEYKF